MQKFTPAPDSFNSSSGVTVRIINNGPSATVNIVFVEPKILSLMELEGLAQQDNLTPSIVRTWLYDFGHYLPESLSLYLNSSAKADRLRQLFLGFLGNPTISLLCLEDPALSSELEEMGRRVGLNDTMERLSR